MVSELTGRYVLRLAEEVRSTGATFTLAAVPSKWSLMDRRNSGREPDFADYVQAWSHRNGVEYLDLKPAFREYSTSAEGTNRPAFFAINGHFTEAGHLLVAREIARKFPDAFMSQKTGPMKR